MALFTHFITCGIWEAVYIIDGLLKNKSVVQPDTLHADTQGQSTPVFGLSYLLGIKLMPRIRNWKDLIFFRPDRQTHYQHIDALFRETIDWTFGNPLAGPYASGVVDQGWQNPTEYAFA